MHTAATTCIAAISWLLFSGASYCADTAPELPDQVKFSVRDYTRSGIPYGEKGKEIRVLMEPIAFLKNGELTHLPDGEPQDQFEKKFYSPGTKFTLYVAGTATGAVEIVRPAFEVQCWALSSAVNVTPPKAVSGMRMALASSATFKDAGYHRRAPSQSERSAVLDVAYSTLRTHQTPAVSVEKAKVSNVTAFEGPLGVILVGSVVAITPVKDDGDRLDAVFTIVERDSDGTRPGPFIWFHTGSESTLETQDLVDLIDIDGDGTPEIVAQVEGYESVGYHIYQRKQGRWVDFYEQVASGC